MAATTKLIVWNDALRELGDHPLSDTTTANTRQKALNDAWDHAVEYTLSRRDWNFARRRATLSAIADSSYPPFTSRYARPSDYLRKVWVKTVADDEFQVEHAEVGAVIYGFAASPLMEYISDHADNYDPANWPPQFTRVMVLYLAMLIAPKLGKTGNDDAKSWFQKVDIALSEAERIESVTTINAAISTVRLPVIRRAIELLGQSIGGTVPANSDADFLRWQINKGWTAAVNFLLEQAPWNFALRRATLASVADSTTFPPYTYAFDRPANFLKRVWVRGDPNDTFEADYAEAGSKIYGFAGTKVMEYIANDTEALTVANWPTQFAECVSLYLAAQVAPAGTTVTDENGKTQRRPSARDGLLKELQQLLDQSRTDEAVQHQTKSIAPTRLPVMRRAIEFMGQAMVGFIINDDQTSRLRWAMQQSWDHSVRYVLSQGAWNFATKRALFTDGAAADDLVPADSVGGIVEGYSVPPAATDTDDMPSIAGYDYGYPLPDDFLHKIWLRADVANDAECPHQFMGGYVFTNFDPSIMEYIAEDDDTTDPANWPALFMEAVAAYLALTVAPEIVVTQGARGARVTAPQLRDKLEAVFHRKLSDAKNKDAIQQYPSKMATGNFARARAGASLIRRLH